MTTLYEVAMWVEQLCTIASARRTSSETIKQLFESVEPVPTSRQEFISAVADWFRVHPQDIERWHDYSADKRGHPSPYIRRIARRLGRAGDEQVATEVGFLDTELGHTDVSRHVDEAQAAADFLHRELNWVLRRRRVS